MRRIPFIAVKPVSVPSTRFVGIFQGSCTSGMSDGNLSSPRVWTLVPSPLVHMLMFGSDVPEFIVGKLSGRIRSRSICASSQELLEPVRECAFEATSTANDFTTALLSRPNPRKIHPSDRRISNRISEIKLLLTWPEATLLARRIDCQT